MDNSKLREALTAIGEGKVTVGVVRCAARAGKAYQTFYDALKRGGVHTLSDAIIVRDMALEIGFDIALEELEVPKDSPTFPTGTDPEEATTSRRRLYAASSKAESEKPAAPDAVASLASARKKKACKPSRRWCATGFGSSTSDSPDFAPLPATGTDGR